MRAPHATSRLRAHGSISPPHQRYHQPIASTTPSTSSISVVASFVLPPLSFAVSATSSPQLRRCGHVARQPHSRQMVNFELPKNSIDDKSQFFVETESWKTKRPVAGRWAVSLHKSILNSQEFDRQQKSIFRRNRKLENKKRPVTTRRAVPLQKSI